MPEAADDWTPVGQQKDDWQAVGPATVPTAFVNRVERGSALTRILKSAAEGYGDPTPTGLADETIEAAINLGIFHDPTKGPASPVQFMNELLALPTAKAFDTLVRGANAGLHGAASALGSIVDALGGRGEAAEREAINFGNWAMIEGGMGRFSRPQLSAAGPQDQAIGGLPIHEDFKVASQILSLDAKEATPAEIEKNLRALWEDKGIHPAEALHDALNDAFVKETLTTPTDDAGEPLRAVGSDVSGAPSLAQQPSPPAASLVTAVQDLIEKLYDIGHDIQMLATPMARGTQEAQATAKDFANTLRRNRWEWSRIDDDIAKRFTPEQRERMWNAADEESVLRQELKEMPEQLQQQLEHMGLSTLTPEERNAVTALQTRAQASWLRAVDLGMVEGEGLPSYTPRMIVNAVGARFGDKKGIPLNGLGSNLSTLATRRRKYLTAEETEAAAKGALGEGAEIARDIRVLPLRTAQLEDAIAGRTLINAVKEAGKRTGEETAVEGFRPDKEWFTIDHPAFRTWRPKFKAENEEPGAARVPVRDEDGNIIFEQVPIYVRGDFEGPLRSVLTTKNGKLYTAAMDVKGKTMSLIMNSPLIHNAVEWGRALPAMPGKVATFKIYFEGNRAKNNPELMREAIDSGLVPIGHRFFNQDISSIMEEPNLTPGRSWTAKVLSAVPGLFDADAGASVARAIDKAGNFWHNTLLWDRVGDLQMGLYTNFKDELVGKGVDAQTAARAAAHWANRYAGALPIEAMSDNARKIANLFFFSRSFTLGNVGAMKDMFTGLPRDVMAQVGRDVGQLDPEAAGYIKSLAVRKAVAVVAMDMGLMYVGNSILQSSLNVMLGDSSLSQEMHDYAARMKTAMGNVLEHPMSLLQPFNFFQSLSATSRNEPEKQDRLLTGYAKDGTAIYARNPAGKIGEEFVGWATGPLDMIRRKLGTIARPIWQIMANDKGFGRKVYDPSADTPAKYLQNIGSIVAHLAKSQIPENQISAFTDLVKGEGDAKVNALEAFGPIAGLTFSKGAPGGPAVGELYHAKEQHEYAVQAAIADIRKQIVRGDVAGARQQMMALGIPTGLQNFYIRTGLNPATRLGGKTIKDFYTYATPEQKLRLENARAMSNPAPAEAEQ